ncbi:aspartyl/glutamyl-tRNA(Asn/Gln) amidotransferasesubunit B [Striga asiatica]|uniref:Aspartyl/glutamyl-tRNA(Asn/Gln) amidotransferasesubunit B n=1 Tax=Striga asiatica TaxID=4170 RepID=A0A5A7RCE7_STRAF|nr:aspartyl/glutamyl-tRNA(Asn/Gln) amidotransferasesubunit B [Striga asiatica]
MTIDEEDRPHGSNLSPLAPDPPGQLDILGHNRHPLSMNGAEVGVLEQTHQVRLGRFLQGGDGGALEAEVCLEVLRDFPDKPLEGELPDEQLGALLVLANLPESHRAGAEAVGLLDAAGGGGGFPGGLGGQLLPRSLAAGGFPRSLFGTRHLTSELDRCIREFEINGLRREIQAGWGEFDLSERGDVCWPLDVK